MFLWLVLGSVCEQAEGAKVQPSGQHTRNSSSEKPIAGVTNCQHKVRILLPDVFGTVLAYSVFNILKLPIFKLEIFHVKI